MLVLVLLQVATASPPPLLSIESITRRPCETDAGNDVVVCGGTRDRYRLPLPRQSDPDTDYGVRGGTGSGVAAITPAGRCGLFAGERRCGKAEAVQYGYGGGRDPVSVLVKLVAAPDAE